MTRVVDVEQIVIGIGGGGAVTAAGMYRTHAGILTAGVLLFLSGAHELLRPHLYQCGDCRNIFDESS